MTTDTCFALCHSSGFRPVDIEDSSHTIMDDRILLMLVLVVLHVQLRTDLTFELNRSILVRVVIRLSFSKLAKDALAFPIQVFTSEFVPPSRFTSLPRSVKDSTSSLRWLWDMRADLQDLGLQGVDNEANFRSE